MAAGKRTVKFSRKRASEIVAGNLRGRIRTRDGRPVRILTFDARGPHPVVGLIYMEALDIEMAWQWDRRGIAFCHSECSSTIVNFNLVIELKDTLTVPRHRRGPNKRTKR